MLYHNIERIRTWIPNDVIYALIVILAIVVSAFLFASIERIILRPRKQVIAEVN